MSSGSGKKTNPDPKLQENKISSDVASGNASEERIKLLELQLEQSQNRLKESWMWPKIVAVVLTVIVIVPQFLTILDLYNRSREVQTLVKDANIKTNGLDLRFDQKIANFDSDSRIRLSEATEKTNSLVKETNEKLDKFVDENNVNIKSLRDSITLEVANRMEEIEIAQRCLTLVAMGSEQSTLKHNPNRGLIFAEAARRVYEENLARFQTISAIRTPKDGVVLAAVYPAIWNLEMDCHLQLQRFPQLKLLAESVIGNRTSSCLEDVRYCALRTAFYYKALSMIPEVCDFNNGIHKDRLVDQGGRILYVGIPSTFAR